MMIERAGQAAVRVIIALGQTCGVRWALIR